MRISCLVVLVLATVVAAADAEQDRQEAVSDESYEDAQTENVIGKPTGKEKESGKGENEVVTVEKPLGGSETEKYGSLSQGFQLHKLDLLTANMGATGSKVFKALPLEDCISSRPIQIGKKNSQFYNNAEDVYHKVSASAGVGVNLQGAYTFGASVAAVTNNLVSGNTEVEGLSLDITNTAQAHTLKHECLYNQPLSDNLIQDFLNLEKEVSEPWKKNSWTNYENFIERYGSHIVKEVQTGSSIHQYVFAESSKHFSQHDFSIKACASLTGTSEGTRGNISVCSEYKTEELKNASRLSMERQLVVRGGTPKTRAALQSAPHLTSENIMNFMLEGETNPSPILYKFHPIWTILKTWYNTRDHIAKVLNLEQYYKGFLHYGCAYLKTLNKRDMQMFVHSEDSTPEYPQYICRLTHEGCHSFYDCVNKTPSLPPFIFATCGCNGESCVRYKDEKLISGSTKKIAQVKQDEDDENGCSGGFMKPYCTCPTPSSQWRTVWSYETADMVALSASLAKRRRDQIQRKQASKRCPKHAGKCH